MHRKLEKTSVWDRSLRSPKGGGSSRRFASFLLPNVVLKQFGANLSILLLHQFLILMRSRHQLVLVVPSLLRRTAHKNRRDAVPVCSLQNWCCSPLGGRTGVDGALRRYIYVRTSRRVHSFHALPHSGKKTKRQGAMASRQHAGRTLGRRFLQSYLLCFSGSGG